VRCSVVGQACQGFAEHLYTPTQVAGKIAAELGGPCRCFRRHPSLNAKIQAHLGRAQPNFPQNLLRPFFVPSPFNTECVTLVSSSEACEGPEGSQRTPRRGESQVRPCWPLWMSLWRSYCEVVSGSHFWVSAPKISFSVGREAGSCDSDLK
jgi:hypothetical protein